jgi:hypothetical protein
MKMSSSEVENKASELCYNPILRTNLIVLVIIWMTVAFAYFLIAYELKYIGGDNPHIYLNAVVASAAEICGKLSSSPTMIKLGIKPLYYIAFTIAGFGSGMLIPFGQN